MRERATTSRRGVAAEDVDVEDLVARYVKSASNFQSLVSLKNHKPTGAAAKAVLALSPQQQAVAAQILMHLLAKAADVKDRSTVWWNFLACIRPYAGMTALMQQLLRRRLPLDDASLAEMIGHCTELRSAAGHARAEPTGKMIRLAERNLNGQAPVGRLRRELVRLKKQLGTTGEDRKLRRAIARLLGV